MDNRSFTAPTGHNCSAIWSLRHGEQKVRDPLGSFSMVVAEITPTLGAFTLCVSGCWSSLRELRATRLASYTQKRHVQYAYIQGQKKPQAAQTRSTTNRGNQLIPEDFRLILKPFKISVGGPEKAGVGRFNSVPGHHRSKGLSSLAP